MKRIVCILMMAALALGLLACDRAAAQPNGPADADLPPAATEPVESTAAPTEPEGVLPAPAGTMTRLMEQWADIDCDGAPEGVAIDSDDERWTVLTVGLPSTKTSIFSFTDTSLPGRSAAIPNFVMLGNTACTASSVAVPLVAWLRVSESSAATSYRRASEITTNTRLPLLTFGET